MVVIDRHRRTAIVLQTGPKWVRLVMNKSGLLKIKSLRVADYADMGFEPLNVDLAETIERFLNHSGGTNEAVKRELDRLKSLI